MPAPLTGSTAQVYPATLPLPAPFRSESTGPRAEEVEGLVNVLGAQLRELAEKLVGRRADTWRSWSDRTATIGGEHLTEEVGRTLHWEPNVVTEGA